jgi:putative DNA primase/helicase
MREFSRAFDEFVDPPKQKSGKSRADDDQKARNDHVSGHGRDYSDAAPLRLTRVSDVEAVPVEWLWTGRLARGKLTLLAGDPGIGKSQIATDIIARTSAGLYWPDGGRADVGSVIIISAEDALRDTIRPRLEAAGAELPRVHVLGAVIENAPKVHSFNLQDHIAYLSQTVASIGDVVLIVIDPITSYMGAGIDSHRTTDVRAVLEPLIRFADETGIAVLAISHPPKSAQGKAINSVTGSLAYVAAARMVFIAIEEPETERRLLLPVKNNLAPPSPGLGYRLEQSITLNGIVASRVVWDGQPVFTTANEAVRASNASGTDKVKEAEQFLLEQLRNGPVCVDGLFDAAARHGVAEKTLRRAGGRLGVAKTKRGFHGGWAWSLPDTLKMANEDAPTL